MNRAACFLEPKEYANRWVWGGVVILDSEGKKGVLDSMGCISQYADGQLDAIPVDSWVRVAETFSAPFLDDNGDECVETVCVEFSIWVEGVAL